MFERTPRAYGPCHFTVIHEYPQARWLRIAAPPAQMTPADEDDEIDGIDRPLALA